MPVALGSVAIGAQAITGNPPAGSMGKFQQLPRYKVRVLDPVTGAEIIPVLPHLHQSSFEIIMPQAGMAGVSAIGQVTLPLFPPLSDEYAWAKVLYDKLDHMQRLEFYAIDDDGAGVSGDPSFTAVLTELTKTETSYQIVAQDSYHLLQLSRTLRATTFSDRTDVLARYALNGYQMTFGSDLSSLGAFTNDGGWTQITDGGFKSVQCGGSGDGLLYTTTSFDNTKYANMLVEAPFHITTEQLAGKSASAECVAAVTDANNYVMGRAVVRFLAANSRLAVDAEVWQKSGGVLTMKSQTKEVIVINNASSQLTIGLLGYQSNATTYGWYVLINGVDTTSWYQNVGSGGPTGAIGVRSYKNGAQGNEVAIVQHHIVFLSKLAIFQPGQIALGSQLVNQPIPQQPLLDMLQLASATENFQYRKNPKAGLNKDTLDFAQTVGADLSGIVRFEEGVNIVSGGNEANAEPFNTAIIGAAQPGFDGTGQQAWYDITAINKYGLILDVASISLVTDSFAVRRATDSILNLRKQPSLAKRFVVLRDERHAELPGQNKPTGLAYREGDWVELHVPRQGLYHQRAQIATIKVTEGVPTMEITFDQFPRVTDRIPGFDRLIKTVTDQQLRTAEVSLKIPGGTALYDRRLLLPINPWKMRVLLTNTQTITDSTKSVVNFDINSSSGAYDSVAGFNTTSHQYTVPLSGTWDIAVSLLVGIPSVPNSFQNWQALIFVNGVQTMTAVEQNWLQSAGGNSFNDGTVLAGRIALNTGDLVDVRFYPNCGANSLVIQSTSTSQTVWDMHLLSG